MAAWSMERTATKRFEGWLMPTSKWHVHMLLLFAVFTLVQHVANSVATSARPPQQSIMLNSTGGKDGPSCGRAAATACATIGGALSVAEARGLRSVALRCATGHYSIDKVPLATPHGMDVVITLPAPPHGQHRSYLSCGKGVKLPCLTVGDAAVLTLNYLSIQAMMAAAGPGGNLTSRSCKFFGGGAGQLALLAGPPSKQPGQAALPFINITDADVGSKPAVNEPVALLPEVAAAVTARIWVGLGNYTRPPPTMPLNTSMDVFKGYPPELIGKDCWQPHYRTITPPSPKKLLIVAADGSGDFTTIQAAVNAIPEGGRSSWEDGVTVHVKAGVYQEVVCLNLHKRFVTLRGDGAHRTTIASEQGSVELMWPNGSTLANRDGNWPSCGVLRVVPDDFRLEDIGVHNSGTAGGNHNVALQVLGERVSAVRTRLVGGGDAVGFLNVRQHNPYDPARGQYLIVDSYVEGAGPDIFCLLGNSTVRNTTILNRAGGNCVYYSGFLTFDDCDFISTKGMIFGNTFGNHVLRVGGGTRVRKSVLNLAAIQRADPGQDFDLLINVSAV
eukprot:SAG11_NODE_1398_length_5024_cov_5.738680_4_plen_558_part_00